MKREKRERDGERERERGSDAGGGGGVGGGEGGFALTSGPKHMNEGFVLTKQREAKQCQRQLATSGGQPRAR